MVCLHIVLRSVQSTKNRATTSLHIASLWATEEIARRSSSNRSVRASFKIASRDNEMPSLIDEESDDLGNVHVPGPLFLVLYTIQKV